MPNERVITLGDDGVFAAPARGAACYLMFDSSVTSGRWLLSFDEEGAETASLISIHVSLDSGLKALAEQAGWANRRFSVSLSDEDCFIRPGKVPASEVMAALGYVLVPSIVAFAVFEPGVVVDRQVAEAEVRRRLANLDVAVGSIDPVGFPDTAWCCDLTVPFEGYVHRDAVEHVVADTFAAVKDLEIVDFVEGMPFTEVAPNRADVTPIFSEAA